MQHQIQKLEVASQFLVTPRWAPDEKSLLVSGFHGVGLHQLFVSNRQLRTLSPSFVGRTAWKSPDIIHLHLFPGTGGSSEVIQNARMTLSTGALEEIPPSADQWIDPQSGLLHHVYWNRENRRIVYQWFRQRLTIVEQQKTLFQQDDVWGVSVSPNGQQVAFSQGLLARGQLFVYDQGTVHRLGAGIHANWSPDGRFLVYARPEANDTHTPAPLLTTDQLQLTGADLYLWNRDQQKTSPLTQTPDRWELEPSFSPSGQQIACADWKSGQILLLPVSSQGE